MHWLTWLLLVYICLATLFFCFPRLLHRGQRHPAAHALLTRPALQLCAHRGGAGEQPENSLAAFAAALAADVHYLELDVRATADGHWVLAHDAQLATNDRPLAELSLAQLPASHPPTLDELLSMLGAAPVVLSIDVKTNRLEDVRAVGALVSAAGFADRALLGCITNVPAAAVRAALPTLGTFFGARDVIRLLVLAALGLLPFCALPADVLQMPFALEGLRPALTVRGLAWLLPALRPLWPLFALLNWHLRRRGVPVTYFLAESPADFALCRRLGAAAMTDWPARARLQRLY